MRSRNSGGSERSASEGDLRFLDGRPDLDRLVDALLSNADAWDVKRARSAKGGRNLREFLAAMFSYAPAWLKLGARLRNAVAVVSGVRLPPLVMDRTFTPRDIPFTPGARLEFFTVVDAREGEWWIAQADDAAPDRPGSIRATMIAAIESDEKNGTRFSVLTVVHYLSWRGRLYYGLIRPMHYAGVTALVRVGARGKVPETTEEHDA